MDIVIAGTIDIICKKNNLHVIVVNQALRLKTYVLRQQIPIVVAGDAPTSRHMTLCMKCEIPDGHNCLATKEWIECESGTNINFVYKYGMLSETHLDDIRLSNFKAPPALVGQRAHVYGHLFFPDYVTPELVPEHIINADKTGVHSAVGPGS